MNFSKEIKEEIVEKGVGGQCCKKAFLAGFIRSTGSIIRSGNDYGFECSTDVEQAMEYAVRLIKSLFDYDVGDIFVYEDKLNKKDRYYVECLGERAVEILFNLGILGKATEGDYEVRLKSNRELLEKDCCRRAFIKGMFLGSGHCTLSDSDSNTGYHLEVVFTHAVPASDFADLLAGFDLFAKIITRRKNVVVYIKSAEEITDFLALIGSTRAVLKITDTVVQRQMSNSN
ncbi:MAG: DNA-binding protein WhiA [Clostridia bacterium]|nr:DNA-binding protein WhiA [Clostridia bacterium]